MRGRGYDEVREALVGEYPLPIHAFEHEFWRGNQYTERKAERIASHTVPCRMSKVQSGVRIIESVLYGVYWCEARCKRGLG